MHERIFAPLAVERTRPRVSLVAERPADSSEKLDEAADVATGVGIDTDRPMRRPALVSVDAAWSEGLDKRIWFVPEMASVSDTPKQNSAPARTGWTKAVTAAFQNHMKRQKQKRTMCELQALDKHILRDIGIEPSDLWNAEGLPPHLVRRGIL